MKIKSKIVLFVCAFALIFSVLSVSCFAYEPLIGEEYVYQFSSTPDIYSPSGSNVSFDVTDQITIFVLYPNPSEDVYKPMSSFVVELGTITIGNGAESFVYNGTDWVFFDSDGNESVVSPPKFYIDELPSNFYFNQWLFGNISLISPSDLNSESFYDNLYYSISDAVFGVGASLSSEQVMTLTLISTILSYAFILLPLLLVIGFVLRCFRL